MHSLTRLLESSTEARQLSLKVSEVDDSSTKKDNLQMCKPGHRKAVISQYL